MFNDKTLHDSIMEICIRESPEYREIRSTLTITESSKIALKTVLVEDTFKDYLAYLITRYKKFGSAITIQDIQHAMENILRRRAIEEGWSEEELKSQISSQLSDQGIIQSLYYELRQGGVPYILPK